MKKISKIFSLLLSCILFISTAAFAAYSDNTALSSVRSYNGAVSIKGELDTSYAGKTVSLMILDKNADLNGLKSADVKYINDVKVNDFGKYTISCRLPDGVSAADCKVYARIGSEDITSSVIEAIQSVEDCIEYSAGITQDMVTSTVTVAISDDFLVGDSYIEYVPVLAFYDSQNVMLSVKVGERNQNVLQTAIPGGTAKTKAFVWRSIKTMLPLCNSPEKTVKDNLNVLIIGNSFSVDGTYYLKNIAKAQGVNMNVAVIQHGGATIGQIYENSKDEASTWFNFSWVGGGTKNGVPLSYAFEQAEWDYVLLQQFSGSGSMDHYSDDTAYSWQPYMNYVAKYVKEKQPDASLGLQMTWAYEKGYSNCAGDTEADRLKNRSEMFKACYENNIKAAKDIGKYEYNEGGDTISLGGYPIKIIPSGYAVQYARNYEVDGVKKYDTTWDQDVFSAKTTHDEAPYTKHVAASELINDEEKAAGKVRLNRDGFHMSNEGRYLVACTWFEAITGKSVLGNTFRPGAVSLDSAAISPCNPIWIDYDAITEENVLLLQQIAHEAVDAYNKGVVIE